MIEATAVRIAAGFFLAIFGIAAVDAGDAWAAAFIFGVLGVAVGFEAGKARKGRG